MLNYNFVGDMNESLEVTLVSNADGTVTIESKRVGAEAKRMRFKSSPVTSFKDAKVLWRKLFILGFKQNNGQVRAALQAVLGSTIKRVKDMAFYTTWD